MATEKKVARLEKLSLSLTTNLGNYESMKLEAEWTPLEGETEAQSVSKVQQKMIGCITAALTDRLHRKLLSLNSTSSYDMEQGKMAANGQPIQKLTLETEKEQATVQAIVKKIEQGVKLDTIFAYYTFEAKALGAIEAAAVLNCININW